MRRFRERLAEHNSPAEDRRWLYVPYDQLTDGVGPLSREEPATLGIVLLENPEKARRRPYHKQKLALVLANQRHFAIEQAERGVAVRYEVTNSYREALEALASELGPLRVMRPAERELRVELAPLFADGALEELPHEGWLTSREAFDRSQSPGKPFRMDAFYREVRRESDILMSGGKPVGGKFSFDAENREPWSGDPPAPELPTFPDTEIKSEVLELIESDFDPHPGTLDPAALPVTRADADRVWEFAMAECMEYFGPYEDAMSVRSSNLFHTHVSFLLNLHRLLPADVVRDVEAAELPLPSQEGFIRQVLGWREFVRHVHEATDGFRRMRDEDVPVRTTPGDAGFESWAGKAWEASAVDGVDVDGGADPSALDATDPVPPALWGKESGLFCLDQVVSDVWREAYGHHITRLMILGNIATLIGISPRDLTDWFWVAYADAYDWVVEPNVLGMATFGTGELMTTKPYVSGANYIHKMSDYCGSCRFHPKKTCPLTRMYWAFLDRNETTLSENPRLRVPLSSLRKRDPEKREEDRRIHARVRELLAEGRSVEEILESA